MAGSADDPNQSIEGEGVSSLESDNPLIHANDSAVRLDLNSASHSVATDPSRQPARVAGHQALA